MKKDPARAFARPSRTLPALPLVALVWCALIGSATVAAAQSDRCADCHVANAEDGLDSHLQDYQASAHARERVGCSACHRGDSSTFDRHRAHRSVLPGSDPESAVHPTNLPVTCGACHADIFVAFSESRHWLALREGKRVTTCVDCHGEAGSQRTVSVLAKCQRCHQPDSDVSAAMLERAVQLQSRFLDLAKQRRKVENKIHKVDDSALVHELEGGYLQVNASWHRALEAGHALDFERLAEEIDDTEALLGQLLDALVQEEP